MANAQQVWAEKLGGFRDQPDRIRRALGSLPPHPPTLPEFIGLCRQSAAEQPKALPAPMPGGAEIARRVQDLAGAKTSLGGHRRRDFMDHWSSIIRRHEAGEAVPEIALRFARDAIGLTSKVGHETEDQSVDGD